MHSVRMVQLNQLSQGYAPAVSDSFELNLSQHVILRRFVRATKTRAQLRRPS